MPLKMKCPNCTRDLNIPDSLLGKQRKCPACASLILLRPAQPISRDTAVSPANSPGTALRPAQQRTAATPLSKAPGTNCPGCGRAVMLPESTAGKRVKCPACATVWRVPDELIIAEVVPQRETNKEWFDDELSNEYRLAEAPSPRPYPTTPTPRPATRPRRRYSDEGFFAPEKRGIEKGMVGGIAMMAIAAVWFFAGLYVGIFFYYPPVLFLIGVFAFLKGLFSGNVAGEEYW